MNAERLLRSAEHLLSPERKRAFSLSVWNDAPDGEYGEDGCGTVGCVVGDLPILYPEEWHYDPYSELDPTLVDPQAYGLPKLVGDDPLYHAMAWFDIDREDAEWLFVPSRWSDKDQHPHGVDAETVAERIREFVANGGNR